jgi:carbohydrate/starch-binding protein with CBM21 domain
MAALAERFTRGEPEVSLSLEVIMSMSRCRGSSDAGPPRTRRPPPEGGNVGYPLQEVTMTMSAVSLLHGEAGSAPSGTGSFNYFSNFTVLVENIAFDKLVGIWGHDANSGTWSFFPCKHISQVAGNSLEIWQSHVDSIEIDQFDVEYGVSENIFWDNNEGANYVLDTAAAHTDGIGTAVLNPNVYVVSWDNTGGTLTVDILARNIAFAKQIAIVYSTDNWLTFHNAFGIYQRRFPPGTMPHQIQAELWEIKAFVGAGKTGQFAAFYIVGGNTFWDNNFGANYSF